MKRIVIIALILQSALLFGQKHKDAKIENLEIEFEANRMILTFEIANSASDKTHDVVLSFIDSKEEIIIPKNLTGDIGNFISGQGRKKIIWDITSEMDRVEGEIRPFIIIDGISESGLIKGGPDNAFLSILLPGLGDYFVEDISDMRIKPYMKTASAAAFLYLGYKAGKERYADYTERLVKRTTWSPGTGTVVFYETVLERGDTHYWTFRHDAEIYYTLAASIWISDVLWVLNKGYKNSILTKSIKESKLEIDAGPGVFSLNLTF